MEVRSQNNENKVYLSLEVSKYIKKFYKCLICEDEFNQKSDILQHVEGDHLQGVNKKAPHPVDLPF